MNFQTGAERWGFVPPRRFDCTGWRPLRPLELPVYVEDDLGDGPDEIAQAIARAQAFSAMVQMDALPAVGNVIDDPRTVGLIETAKRLGADEFKLTDHDDEEMLFRLL